MAVKIQQLIKRIARVNETTHSMNRGHRAVFTEWMQLLIFQFDKSTEEQRGIRLINGNDNLRALVDEEEIEDDLADVEADIEDYEADDEDRKVEE